jgi:predicted MFS family arabinose efflux permease
LPQLVRARLAVLALFTLNGALLGAWASRLPAIQQTFDLSPRDLGFLLLLPAVGAISSFPLAGSSCDRYGAAKVAQIVGLTGCPLMLGIAWSSDIALLALLITLFGGAMGALDVSMNSWGAEVERTAGRPIMSSFHAFFSLGLGLGAAGGALAAWAEIGYPYHFTIFAALLSGLVWASLCEWPNVPADTNAGGRKLGVALPRGRLLIVAVVAFAAAVSEGGMENWSALFLTNVLETSESEGALGFVVFSVAMVAMRLRGDRIVSAIGPALTMRYCGLAALAGSILTVIAPVSLMVHLGYLLMGGGYSIVFPLIFSRAASDGQLTPGRAIAAVSIFSYGGMLAGPPLIGFMAEEITLRAAFVLFAILALVIALGAGAFHKREDENAAAGLEKADAGG